MAGYTVGIASETKAFKQGVDTGIIDPLEDAQKELTEIGRNRGLDQLERGLRDAQDETEDLKRETKSTAEAIEQSYKSAYRKTKNESDDATSKMKDGFQEAKDEAQQSGREAAASFSGGFDDVADFVQETLANALSGFGPIGLAAGVALAAVLGTAMAGAEAAQEKLQAARERASELASTLYENKGVIPMQDRVQELFDLLAEESGSGNAILNMIDGWTDFGSTLDAVRRAAKLTGRELGDMVDALAGGDLAKSEDALDAVNRKITELESNVDTAWAWNTDLQSLREARDEIEKTVEANKLAAEINAEVSSSASAQAAERAEAEEAAADRIKTATESVRDEQLSAYDSMRNAAVEKATADDQAFDIEKWLTYVEETRAATDSYRTNLQGMQLTPEEWANLLALPEDARVNIVNSFATTGEEGKARIRAALGDGGAGEAGQQATVSFEEGFNPNADVVVTTDTSDAEAKLTELAKEREAIVTTKPTGIDEARVRLDDLTRERTATVRLVVDDTAVRNYRPPPVTQTVVPSTSETEWR